MTGWWKDFRVRSLVMVCLASAMEKADEAMLPSVYREIGAAFQASPSALGGLTLVRSLTQAAFAPLVVFLAQQYNRATLIAAGALMWAAATVLVGFSTTISQMAIFRAVNGIGLAVVWPSIHSMIADATNERNRGQAFGWLGVAGNMGSILGGAFAVVLASTRILGVEGWRMAFHLVAALSVVVAVLVYLFAVDPRFPKSSASPMSKKERNTFREDLSLLYLDSKNVVQLKSFQIFVAEGVASSFPWAAISFTPMWLELVGFSNRVTAVLRSCFLVATSLGGLFGGFMGDYLSVRRPNSGRIMLAQISVVLGVPLGAILLLGLPYDPSTTFLHGTVLSVMGLCISWTGAATNGPICAEIVPENSRTNVYALERSIKALLGSFAPPVVGLLAENVYGYVPPLKGSDNFEKDKENAVALAKALYASIGVPFVLCSLIYSALYWTYPRDRDRVKEFEGENLLERDVLIPLEQFSLEEESVDEDEVEGWQPQRLSIDKDIDDTETTAMLCRHEDRSVYIEVPLQILQ